MLTLTVIPGEAEGSLFEDNGHGFEFQHGAFLLSHYWAKLNDDGSFVTVTLKNVRGHLSRPERPLVVRLLLGEGAMVCLSCLTLMWRNPFSPMCRLKKVVLMAKMSESLTLVWRKNDTLSPYRKNKNLYFMVNSEKLTAVDHWSQGQLFSFSKTSPFEGKQYYGRWK